MSEVETGDWIVLDGDGAIHRLAAFSDVYVVSACGKRVQTKVHKRYADQDQRGKVRCYRCERIGGG